MDATDTKILIDELNEAQRQLGEQRKKNEFLEEKLRYAPQPRFKIDIADPGPIIAAILVTALFCVLTSALITTKLDESRFERKLPGVGQYYVNDCQAPEHKGMYYLFRTGLDRDQYLSPCLPSVKEAWEYFEHFKEVNKIQNAVLKGEKENPQ
jgi:hypothetical protein